MAATAAASDFVPGDGGDGTLYIGFSGVQAALSEAVGASTMADGGADASTLVGLGGEAARDMFFPLAAVEPGPDSGEPIAVQALALKSFLKLSASPGFKFLLIHIRDSGKAVVFTGHSLGGTIAALAALHYHCISSKISIGAQAPPALCVTFGSPLLGNEALLRAIIRKQWTGNFCHVVSQHDIIPRLLFCPMDAVPAHLIVGMQLQQWAECNNQGGVVSAVTARMADTDQDALRQMIQTNFGAVAMWRKLDALDAPARSPYRPFGTYLLCSPDGAVCVDNPTVAVQMLHATFVSRSSPDTESPEAAHSCYADLVLKIPQQLLRKRLVHMDGTHSDVGISLAPEASGIDTKAGNDDYTDQSIRYPLLNLFKMEPVGLKKTDSFSRWISRELAEVLDSNTLGSDASWSTTETVNVADGSSIPINEKLDVFAARPSLSQDQLFSIIDVSPSWAYTVGKTKVLITGTFLANKEVVQKSRWSCMFGDVEVPAEVLADGSLRSYTPVHHSGRVPFYVTCSNRVACSEVREFEFRDSEAMLPGHIFCPTEEELISFYLRNKLDGLRDDIERVIPVVEVYSLDPWKLSEIHSCIGVGKPRFYFCPRQERESRGERSDWTTPSGYWKAVGTPGHVYSADDSRAIGMKKTMVFYHGRAPLGTKSIWKMNEYRALQYNPGATAGRTTDGSSSSAHAAAASLHLSPQLRKEFSLCRLYTFSAVVPFGRRRFARAAKGSR